MCADREPHANFACRSDTLTSMMFMILIPPNKRDTGDGAEQIVLTREVGMPTSAISS